MPRVVMFSPIWPGYTSKPAGTQLIVKLGVQQVHLA